MNLKKLASGHADIPLLNQLYIEAFPPDERLLSVEQIFGLAGEMPIDILGIYPDEAPEKFAGFFMVFAHEKFAYLMFFATRAEMRSTGIGSKAIKALVAHYRAKPLIFSYESVFEESDNQEQRERRRAFYLKNGFYETGWLTRLNNKEFIIASSEKKLDEAIFEELANEFTSAMKLELKLYRRADRMTAHPAPPSALARPCASD